MILDEFVKIKWSLRTKNYYINKGYTFTGIGTNILIKVSDLSENSNVKIHVKCDICEKEKYIIYQKYLKNLKNGNYYGCSNKCSINKYSTIMLLVLFLL